MQSYFTCTHLDDVLSLAQMRRKVSLTVQQRKKKLSKGHGEESVDNVFTLLLLSQRLYWIRHYVLIYCGKACKAV